MLNCPKIIVAKCRQVQIRINKWGKNLFVWADRKQRASAIHVFMQQVCANISCS